MNSNNRADLNPRLVNQTTARPRPPNTRFVYVNQNTLQPAQNTLNNNAPVIQAPQASNHNSITNKLCKFFKNLLELEREQGRYKESVAVIQKYINKEINIDELGVQLKGNASKATLPDSLMTSLNSNIDDLRREMFYGRVRIDGINPPPENILDLNHQTTVINNINISTASNVNSGTINVRLPTSQLMIQRPITFPPISNAPARPIQPQQQQQQSSLSLSSSQIIRPTIQTAQPNARQIRPASNGNNGAGIISNNSSSSSNNSSATTVFTSQPLVNISNVNLRTIAPISSLRPSVVVPNTISANHQNHRSVAVSTAALTNIKSATVVNCDDLKVESVSSEQVAVASNGSSNANSGKPPIESVSQSVASNISSVSVSLPTNILNHHNYRNKINEIIKSSDAGVAAVLTISDDALNYVSEAMENFSLTLLEQAAVFACHRQELFKDNPSYRKIDDVRSQMKFLQDLEDYQRASEEEKQKAELFKQAKSRSKMDNQEQQKIKETVRKIQEHDKNCDEYTRANSTALKAIGNKRKLIDSCTGVVDDMGTSGGVMMGLGGGAVKIPRFVNSGAINSGVGNNTGNMGASNGGLANSASGGGGGTGIVGGLFPNSQHLPSSHVFINQNFMASKGVRNPVVSRFRNKRIILKDFQLVLDQDVKLKRFKTYKKIFTYGRY